jgi:Fe-S-cluster containining protein
MPAAGSTHPVYCLSIHSSYRCGHSGACCSSGWPIPIETPQRMLLDRAVADGRLTASAVHMEHGENLPAGVAGVLKAEPGGTCVAYDRDARRCRIHAAAGHDALPVSCQQFPRVSVVDRDGAFVTLSAYCPTVARALTTSAELSWRVIRAPGSFAPFTVEGLDARDALPPLLRPGMLMTRDGYRTWETRVIETLSMDGSVETALARCAAATERLRPWRPSAGDLAMAVRAAFAQAEDEGERDDRQTLRRSATTALFAIVRGAVPEGLHADGPPDDVDAAFDRLALPAWRAFAPAVRRYLSAHAFANWCAWQGRGLRTVLASLDATLAVLRTEIVRQCGRAGRTLDEALLVEAFRAADLLVVHLADRQELARRLSVAEEG